MTSTVLVTEDPAEVLERGRKFLQREPVLHNLILTLLTARVSRPEPGRYWLAVRDGDVAGVAFQSPLSFFITITPMAAEIVDGVVETITAAGERPPGVSGEAGSAARFAGQWTERTKSAARPELGQRLYEISEVSPPAVSGAIRQAVDADAALLAVWLHGFHVDIGEPAIEDPAVTIANRVMAGQFWVWEHDGPVSMAALTTPVAGVCRVQAVYTPPEKRNQGYASACVAAVSTSTLEAGHRCILYTDLGNPTSNSIYRKIGYRAIAEVIRYAFE